MKVTGLKEMQKSFKSLSSLSVDTLGAVAMYPVAKMIEERAKRRMARITGETIENTGSEMTKGGAMVYVNVPWASYYHQGQRKDGSRKIKNYTPPGEQYFLRKSALEVTPNMGEKVVQVITETITKYL